MIDPFESSPVWEDDQVITRKDLIRIISELSQELSFGEFTKTEKIRFNASMATLTILVDWLDSGKADFFRLEDID